MITTLRMLIGGFLWLGFIGLSTADEDKSIEEEAKEFRAELKNLIASGSITGEVLRVSEKDRSLTIRVTWYSLTRANGNNRNRPPRRGGNNNRNQRPPMFKAKENYKDYEITLTPAALVRTNVLPPKTDANGRPAAYTFQELNKLRLPLGQPGYHADFADLKEHHVVTVSIVRERGEALDTDTKFTANRVLILGEDKNPNNDDNDKGKKKKK